MRDFGGRGIKRGWGNTWAYYMNGTRGVFIQTKTGKKYLLGSDTPDRLAAVVRARSDQSRDHEGAGSGGTAS